MRMKKYLTLTIIALGLGAARAVLLAFEADLSGSYKIPANASPATGTGFLHYGTVTGILDFNIIFSGLVSPATAFHIHHGDAGVNGPVVVPFAAGDGSWVGATLPSIQTTPA